MLRGLSASSCTSCALRRFTYPAVIFAAAIRRAGIFRLLLASTRAAGASGLDNADRAIDVDECLIRYATNVLFGDFVDPLDGAKQLSPVAVAGLICRELRGQSRVFGQASDQVRLGARLYHL